MIFFGKNKIDIPERTTNVLHVRVFSPSQIFFILSGMWEAGSGTVISGRNLVFNVVQIIKSI